ncbi:hypothetical protein JMJ55_17870 [Belnapia sp. T6]|uniref:Antitoxin n=1 Tax=Belnapia mucosa TaxID=2804532 RepID=A0ABS1VA46_9PROT|nr:hypothetical protein [Belnapia mucosa]MBL6457208.1 hypothetical protein [Belnapia mucosa]
MHVPSIAEFTASDLKTSGPVLDAAVRGVVRIRRRGQTFVLLSEARLDEIVAEASDPRPKSLADLVQGYDAEDVKNRLRGWEAEEAVGKEGL